MLWLSLGLRALEAHDCGYLITAVAGADAVAGHRYRHFGHEHTK